MTIITISRGSHSMGRAVAEHLSDALGYECLSRDVLIEASKHYDVPEVKLEHAIRDAPSILERISGGTESYIAYIQSALARHVCADNVVYHGLAGPVLLKNVSHVLRVRIIADEELRISIVMKAEQLDRKHAANWISKVDGARRKWMKSLYNLDPADPTLYDLIVNVPRFDVSSAADLIAQAAQLPQFETTKESQQQVEDLALACEVKAALVGEYSSVSVTSTHGNVVVYDDGGSYHIRSLKRSAAEVKVGLKGVNNIEVHAGVAPPPGAV